jgi:Tol biopolymer transport system component
MSALGGPSRRISTGPAVAVCWSPDGEWLLWGRPENSARSSVRIAPAGGGEERKLLDPPISGFGDFEPAVSPDGREVVWNRCEDGYNCALYLSGFQDGRLTGKPRQITQDRGRKAYPVWTHDGKEILYIGGHRTSEVSIYRMRSSGGEPRRIEGIGANASCLTLAAKSNRLLYSTLSINYDIQRADLNAADTIPQRFISSTRYEGNASYSPDGKRIAFSSNRGGVRQIWAADSGGGSVSPLTSFPDGSAAAPKWSPDGHYIIFDARIGGDLDVYSVPADGGSVRRLTDHVGQNHLPSWSPDGKWIYFGSTRAGPHEIFRARPDGSGVQQITHNGGYYGLVAPDGKWLYYSIPGKGLWKAPADGGEATEVLPPGLMPGLYNFVAKERGIYAVGARRPEGYPVVLYPIDGERPRTLIVLGSLPNMFPEVSPDGRWLLYTTADEPTYEIMLVDNFR